MASVLDIKSLSPPPHLKMHIFDLYLISTGVIGLVDQEEEMYYSKLSKNVSFLNISTDSGSLKPPTFPH